jgi:anaerobic selenocysteine-containing dehydrogenase
MSVPGRETIRTTCPRDCYDACGILVTRRDGGGAQVRGDPDHPVSRGKLCRKCAVGYNGAFLDPELRLNSPLRRTGAKGRGEFEAVSWEEALSEIAEGLKGIASSPGPEAILNAHYTGTFSVIGYHFGLRFFNRLGATEVDPDTICNNAGHVALGYLYGTSELGFDPRTSRDSSCVMVWGANPSASAPHAHEQWLPESGARIVVVDPVRTPTAEAADLHLQPFPGSDAALAFGLLHVIVRDGLADLDFVGGHTVGFEELEASISACSPAWAERTTGVAASLIESAAHAYAEGPSLLWLGQGFQRQARGGNAMRSCALLPALTGNLGKPGAGFLYLNGLERRGVDDAYLCADHLRRGAPRSIGHMDLAARLEDRERAGALVCWNINVAASNPEQARLRRAMEREDLLTVAIDLFETDTTDLADYVLPAASFLEFDDLVASYFDLSLSAQVAALPPLGDSLPNQEIFRRLAASMGFSEPELFESDREMISAVLRQIGVEEDFDSLAAKGTVPISEDPVVQFADLAFPTPSGRIELASARAQADGHPRVPHPHADERPADDRLRLLSPASPWTLNDTFTNDRKITKRLGEATVTLHPLDAADRGLSEGDEVVLENEIGRLLLELEIAETVPRGVALSCKGRWPRREAEGANVNTLNPGQKADMGESTSVHGVEVTVRGSLRP